MNDIKIETVLYVKESPLGEGREFLCVKCYRLLTVLLISDVPDKNS